MSDEVLGILGFFAQVLWELRWWILAMICIFVVGMDITYHEIARPVCGKLLRRKPMLRKDLHWEQPFRVANNGKRPQTRRELNDAYLQLKQTIETRSYYKKHDKNLLDDFYRHGFAEILYAESMRKKEYEYTYSKPKVQIAEWRKVLGVSATERDTKVIKMAYRKAVMLDHPDRGGTGKRIPVLTKAIDEARKELRFV